MDRHITCLVPLAEDNVKVWQKLLVNIGTTKVSIALNLVPRRLLSTEMWKTSRSGATPNTQGSLPRFHPVRRWRYKVGSLTLIAFGHRQFTTWAPITFWDK